MNTMLAIDPTLDEQGAFVALADSLGTESAKPVELEKGAALTDFTVAEQAISIELAAKLQIAPVFGGAISYGEQAYYLDAVVYTDRYASDAPAGKAVRGTRWGIGLRVALRVSNLKVDFSGGFGAVAAAVQLGLARATYQVIGIGLGTGGFAIVLGSMPMLASFSYETYQKMQTMVNTGLKDYILANQDKLTPQPFGVQLIAPIVTDPVIAGYSVYYAMRWLAGRRSLADALDAARPELNVDPIAVRQVYELVAPGTPERNAPSAEAEAKADRWLKI